MIINEILYILGIFIFGLLSFEAVKFLAYYWDVKTSDHIKISFDQFKIFYNLNRKKYYLGDFYEGPYVYRNNDYYRAYFLFNYLDWKRYHRFRKQVQKAKRDRQEARITEEFLESVQKDIDAEKEKAMECFKKGIM